MGRRAARVRIWFVICAGLLSAVLADKFQCHEKFYRKPDCVDHPDGYECLCGPGFRWNNQQCVSTALDSRLEFDDLQPARYALLLGKTFPSLSAFTIAVWVRVPKPDHHGTILSYSLDEQKNILRMLSGPTVRLHLLGGLIDTGYSLTADIWTHLSWTWSNADGLWAFYVNGSRYDHNRGLSSGQMLQTAGELLLGQSARRADTKFDTKDAFWGDMVNMNIWSMMRDDAYAAGLPGNCDWSECGDAVEWADFRFGTRGPIYLRWPSGLNMSLSNCLSQDEAAASCDRYCSLTIGAQCKEQVHENVVWPRTKARDVSMMKCPGWRRPSNSSRDCVESEDGLDGIWKDANIEDCLSRSIRSLKNGVKDFVRTDNFNETLILEFLHGLTNMTAHFDFQDNPIDLAAVIEAAHQLVEAQSITLFDASWTLGLYHFAQTKEVYPTLADTQMYFKEMTEFFSNVIDERLDPAWFTTLPIGGEAVKLLNIMRQLSDVISRSFMYHIRKGHLALKDAVIDFASDTLAFKVQVFQVSDLPDLKFPSAMDVANELVDTEATFVSWDARHLKTSSERASMDSGSRSNSRRPSVDPDLPLGYVGVSFILFKSFQRLLPNHDVKSNSPEDNINSRLISFLLHFEKQEPSNLSRAINVQLELLDTFNISDINCVSLIIDPRLHKPFVWSQDNCNITKRRNSYVTCQCVKPGLYAVTTDMYDPKWRPVVLVNIPLQFPSYFGCSFVAAAALVTCLLLVIVRAKSITASIHRQFALCILFSQVVFMAGLMQTNQQLTCQIFSVLINYLILACFAWLMNEAFNLYIVITYAAHSHGGGSSTGSMVRFYILGWIVPGAIVGAFIGSKGHEFFNSEMCFISWDYIWFLAAPAIAFSTVTFLVLVFAAKEHAESSYTKNEKANKIIINHTKAVWTQMIVLMASWAFAIISLRMYGSILKWLYAFFNCLHGSFYLIFYGFLHDEVRKFFRERQKRRQSGGMGLFTRQSEEPKEETSLVQHQSPGNDIELQDKTEDDDDSPDVLLSKKQIRRKAPPPVRPPKDIEVKITVL